MKLNTLKSIDFTGKREYYDIGNGDLDNQELKPKSIISNCICI